MAHQPLKPVLLASLLSTILSLTGGQVQALPVLSHNSEDTNRLKEAGARLVADYGQFQLFEWDEKSRGANPTAGTPKPQWSVIHLNTGPVPTNTAEAKAARTKFEAKPQAGLFLVQLAGPPQPQWVEALEKSGARIVDYIPDNTYLVYGDGNAARAVSRLSASQAPLRWMGPMLADWKVSPNVAHPGRTGKAALAAINTDRLSIQLVVDPKANAGTLNLIRGAARSSNWQDMVVGGQRTITLSLDPAIVSSLAAQPDVISIHASPLPQKLDERQARVVTGQVTAAGQADGPGHMAWLAANGFTQTSMNSTGIVVDVTDSGVDNGLSNPNHFALRTSGTGVGASRVVYSTLFGTPNTGSTLAGCDGHGNINTHIIAAYTDNTADTALHRDSSGYQYGLGINPFVRVGSSVIFDPSNFTNPDYTTLASTAYQNGARISNNSWGANNGGAYTGDSRAYDFLVRDSQPAGAAFPADGNQELLFVFSAGNAGPSDRTVGTPGTAKNVLTVGAQENNQPFGGADFCGVADSGADNPEDAATFSSRGPTTDGRIKPDITAPGTHVVGGVYQNGPSEGSNPANIGGAAPCFDGNGVCGGASPSLYFPIGQQYYTASSGTSHSSPAVAGVASLVYDWYRRTYGTLPSPAMAKAILMNSARWLNGLSTGDNLPSKVQGMGMVNADRAIRSASRLVRDQLSEDIFTASLQTRSFTGRIQDPNQPLRITMAFTDAPGATSGNSTVNSLSLQVVINGIIYRGNNFDRDISIPGGTVDTLNNVQSVFLPAGTLATSTPLSITVVANTIAGDGVPNVGGATDQDFALVATNFTAEPLAIPAMDFLVDDTQGSGNSGGIMDPGESGVRVGDTIRNTGILDLPPSYVRLVSETSGVRVVNGFASMPALAPGSSYTLPTGSLEVALDSSFVCQTTVTVRLDIHDQTGGILASQRHQFQTGGLRTVGSTDATSLGVQIPSSGASTLEVPLDVSIPGTINSMEAKLNITHTYLNDLTIQLVHPDGTTVVLFQRQGGSGDNLLDTVFSDSASLPIASGSAPFSGTYRPVEPLSILSGKAMAGTWRLVVTDGFNQDGGTINAISLVFKAAGCTTPDATGVYYHVSTSDVSQAGPFNVDLGGDDAYLVSSNLGNRTRNTELGLISLSVNAVGANGPGRIFGLLENSDNDMPYSDVGANRIVRARYAIAYSGPGNSASPTTYNLVPNFRLRAGMRFVHNTMLEVQHNSGTGDQAIRNHARELGPSSDLGTPSIYKVDYDPVDVPQVTGDLTQGIQRGIETFATAPDYSYVNGSLVLTDTSIGTYPRPDLSGAADKVYASGGASGSSDFDNPAINFFSLGIDRSVLANGLITNQRIPEPGMSASKAPGGVTVNSTGVSTSRIAILAADFLEGNNGDRTNLASRVRIAPDEVYVLSFRLNSAGSSNNHPYTRFRGRTVKFQWNALLELGAMRSVGSAQGQAIAMQTLPGTGNQVPGSDSNGTVYNLIMPTPLDPDIRRDVAGTLADKFPLLMAEPGPGVNSTSFRDLKIGFDVVDSLSGLSGFENESANNTILNRVEIRRFPAPKD